VTGGGFRPGAVVMLTLRPSDGQVVDLGLDGADGGGRLRPMLVAIPDDAAAGAATIVARAGDGEEVTAVLYVEAGRPATLTAIPLPSRPVPARTRPLAHHPLPLKGAAGARGHGGVSRPRAGRLPSLPSGRSGARRLPTPALGKVVGRESTLKARARAIYAGLPISFEINRGQAGRDVRFLAHGADGTLSLTARDAVLDVPMVAARGATAGKGAGAASGRTATLRLRLVGANVAPRITGLDQLPGRVNYIRGNDRRTWITGVPTYARVDYHDVYPGVDLVYHGRQGRLEYDYVLRPGADPAAIALAQEGAGTLRLDGGGNLVLQGAGGQVRQERPVAYQDIAGKRRPVAARFVLRGDGTAGFALGAYDRRYALTIDPVLNWSAELANSSSASGNGVAADPSGNVYIAGSNQSTTGNAFVTKLTSGGSLVYSTYISGAGGAAGIAVSNAGRAYIVGYTSSSTFPTTANAYQKSLNGSTNAYVILLNNVGSDLIYSTYFGGNSDNYGTAIATDGDSHAYITGYTHADSGFPTKNAYQSGCGMDSNGCTTTAFVAEFDTFATDSSSSLIYSTYFGNGGQTRGYGIAVDGGGNAYVTGETNATNSFPTRNAYQSTCGNGCSSNAFVTKINPNASGDSSLLYSTYLGGSGGTDQGNAIAVDGGGNAYVTGSTTSSDFPKQNSQGTQCGSGGCSGGDAFVAEINPSSSGGGSLVYSTPFGGSGADQGNGIAVDGNGDAYVVGTTHSTDFPTTGDALQSSCGDAPYYQTPCAVGDAFVFVLSPMTQHPTPYGFSINYETQLYSSYLGGRGQDGGNAIALDGRGNVDIAGATQSSNFPGLQTDYSNGNQDAFASQIALGPQISGISPSSGATDGGRRSPSRGATSRPAAASRRSPSPAPRRRTRSTGTAR